VFYKFEDKRGPYISLRQHVTTWTAHLATGIIWHDFVV